MDNDCPFCSDPPSTCASCGFKGCWVCDFARGTGPMICKICQTRLEEKEEESHSFPPERIYCTKCNKQSSNFTCSSCYHKGCWICEFVISTGSPLCIKCYEEIKLQYSKDGDK